MRYTFPFLNHERRPGKPRTKGLTIVRDRFCPLEDQRNFLETYADFVDYVKISNICSLLYPESLFLEKIALYKQYNVTPFLGGLLFEDSYAQGKVQELFDYLQYAEIPAMEISDNIVKVSLEDRMKAVKECCDRGIEVFYEWGDKYPTKPLDLEKAVEEISAIREAGASRIILEESEIEMLLGDHGEKPTAQIMIDLMNRIGLEAMIPEVETKAQVLWFLKTFGPEVNVGPHVEFDMVKWLEPTRIGIGKEIKHVAITSAAKELK